MTLCMFSASFVVTDWAGVEVIKKETEVAPGLGIDLYRWSKDGDSLSVRGACASAEALVIHIDQIGGAVAKLVAGPAALDSGLEIHAPPKAVAELKARIGEIFTEPIAALGVVLFEQTDPAGVVKTPSAALETKASLCTHNTMYAVVDWDAVKPLMQVMLNRSAAEGGCAHFGWSKSGGKLFSHEAYADGGALAAHLESAKVCQAMLLEFAALEKEEIHGPAAELERAVDAAEDSDAAFFVTLD